MSASGRDWERVLGRLSRIRFKLADALARFAPVPPPRAQGRSLEIAVGLLQGTVGSRRVLESVSGETPPEDAQTAVRSAIESVELAQRALVDGEDDFVVAGHTRRALAYALAAVESNNAECVPAGSYYILDARASVGNCAVWWRQKGGYTCDLKLAGLFPATRPSDRPTDVLVPRAVAEDLMVHHVPIDDLRDRVDVPYADGTPRSRKVEPESKEHSDA